jgi:Mn2+/Fe2+ NRAMP family transporter
MQLSLLQTFLIVLGLAALSFLANRAPWLDSPWKEFFVWGFLVCAVVVVLAFFGVWRAMAGFHI